MEMLESIKGNTHNSHCNYYYTNTHCENIKFIGCYEHCNTPNFILNLHTAINKTTLIALTLDAHDTSIQFRHIYMPFI